MSAKGELSQSRTVWHYAVAIGYLGAYYALGYHTPRTETLVLWSLYGAVFLGYLYLVRSSLSLREGLGAAILFRLILLFAIPALSDDYFRFVWDGRLVLHGENPFLHLPAHYVQEGTLPVLGLDLNLFQKLNSPHYYSVYPPVCQAAFGLAALLSPTSVAGSVVVLRLILLLAEIGTFWLLTRLLPILGLPPRHLLWYALNPLVILEVTGNLHFEGLMVFFLLGAFYLLLRQQLLWSAVFFGLAIGVKLVPLLLLPFLYGKLQLRQLALYYGTVAAVLLLLFWPFLSLAMGQHLFASIFLYFHTFEFNAGLYYVVRWFGFLATGKNLIGYITSLFSLLTLAGVLRQAWVSRATPSSKLPFYWLLALTLYLLMSTTVHPWYLLTLIPLTLFTSFRFPVVWSGLAILSYGTYSDPSYTENFWFVALEYTVVLGWLGYELFREKSRRNFKGMLPV